MNKGARFPLRESELPQLRVDDQTLLQWKRDAQDAFHDALANSQSWYRRFEQEELEYKHVYAKNGVNGFVRSAMTLDATATTIETLCRAELKLSLDDVAQGLYCETTSELRSSFAQMYQSRCLDGAFLQVAETRTPEDPFLFAGVKWIAYTSPAPQLVWPRDYICYDHSCSAVDTDGHRVLLSYQRSYPWRRDQLVQDHGMDMTRGETYLFSVYRECEDGVTLHYTARNDAGGNVPAWAAKAYVKFMFERVINMYALSDARAVQRWVSMGGSSSSSPFPRFPDRAISRCCRVCYKSFGVLRGERQCQGCGHSVCKKCLVSMKLFDTQVRNAPSLPIRRVRFCLRCILFARGQQEKIGDGARRSVRPTFHSDSHSDSFFGSPWSWRTTQSSVSSLSTSNSARSNTNWSFLDSAVSDPAPSSSRSRALSAAPAIRAAMIDKRSQSVSTDMLNQRRQRTPAGESHRSEPLGQLAPSEDPLTKIYGAIVDQAALLRLIRQEQQRQARPMPRAMQYKTL